tara:strand:- start:217 stop:423 length:207 start_codon:yes stop_codon:yes gene_type:complete
MAWKANGTSMGKHPCTPNTSWDKSTGCKSNGFITVKNGLKWNSKMDAFATEPGTDGTPTETLPQRTST